MSERQVIGVAPDMSELAFIAVLKAAGSPALSSAHAVYQECVKRRVSVADLARSNEEIWYTSINEIAKPERDCSRLRHDQHLFGRCGLATIQFPLSDGNLVTIDESDAPLVAQYSWRPLRNKTTTYAVAWPRGERKTRKVILLHRLLLNAQSGEEVDHKDGNGLHCCRENLRLATREQNCRNQRISIANRSGYKGVCWDKARQCWAAGIKHNNRTIHLGRFSTAEAAAHAYDDKARELSGAFARLNFPDQGEGAA